MEMSFIRDLGFILILAFERVLVGSSVALGRRGVLIGRNRGRQQRLVNSISSPINNESFSDAEQHDGNLSNGEEAPDGGLFHEVGCDQSRQIRSERKQKDTLYHHPFLLVEGEEGCEHTKRMDGSTWYHIRWIRHWH